MNDVEQFFARFEEIADNRLSNEELRLLMPAIERICTDYGNRAEFFERFRGVNDRDRKLKIVESFNFAISRYSDFEQGLIDENELQRSLTDRGGMALVIGGILALLAGVIWPALGVLAVLAGVGITVAALAFSMYSAEQRRKRKMAVEDIRSFTARLQQEL